MQIADACRRFPGSRWDTPVALDFSEISDADPVRNEAAFLLADDSDIELLANPAALVPLPTAV